MEKLTSEELERLPGLALLHWKINRDRETRVGLNAHEKTLDYLIFDLAHALAKVAAAEGLAKALLDKEVEWAATFEPCWERFCPWCAEPHTTGHAIDCDREIALAAWKAAQ